MERQVTQALKPFTFALWLATGLLFTPSAWPAELVNADFSQGLEGWKTWYARQPTTVSTVDSDTGRALRMLGQEGSRVVVSQGVDVEPES